MIPAQQGFHPYHAPRRMVTLRLVHQIELIFLVIQRAFQIIGQGVGQPSHFAGKGKALARIGRD